MTAKTAKERQAELRARRREAGLEEVRGIYAPPDKHPAIKAAAKKMVKGPT